MAQNKERLGLALSGGGYRAAAYHIGTLRALHFLGILDKVDVISSVSGGSIASAYYLLNKDDFRSFKRSFNKKLQKGVMHLSFVNAGILVAAIVAVGLLFGWGWAWLALPLFWFLNYYILPLSVWISMQYDWHFFHHKTLSDLPDKPTVAINACDVREACEFRFSKHRMWGNPYRDWEKNQDYFTSKDFPLSKAVMASSCVPFAFTPIRIPRRFRRLQGVKQPLLIDGGVFDNQGVHNLMERGTRSLFTKYCIVSNAGISSMADFKHLYNIPQMLLATDEILWQRVKDMQARQLKIETDELDNRGVYVNLLTDPSDEIVEKFVMDIALGLVPKETWRLHGIAEDDVKALRDFIHAQYRLQPEISSRLIEQVKRNIQWDSLEHLRPTEAEIKVARSVKTNLTGLSDKQLYCLAKFSEWMTIVQVRLYLPNLLPPFGNNEI